MDGHHTHISIRSSDFWCPKLFLNLSFEYTKVCVMKWNWLEGRYVQGKLTDVLKWSLFFGITQMVIKKSDPETVSLSLVAVWYCGLLRLHEFIPFNRNSYSFIILPSELRLCPPCNAKISTHIQKFSDRGQIIRAHNSNSFWLYRQLCNDNVCRIWFAIWMPQ